LNDVISTLHKSIQKKTVGLSRDLRSSAMHSGWPEGLARSLSVNSSEGKVSIDYPDELRNDIHSWEYGTEDRRPNAVMRRFMNRVDSKLEG